MISPMPFCPSFEPCEKLTPVHVNTSSARIQNGGGVLPTGASYSRLSLITSFESRRMIAAMPKPISGEINRLSPIFFAWSQSTPLVPDTGDINWFAMPTPIMEPTIVCELDAGSPKYHVPRFQRIAAISRAKTIANPAPLPTCKINSTGSKVMMVNATTPDDVTTPAKFQNPLHTTAMFGSIECV